MSEEELLKKYGCNSLSEFIDTYLDCETAFDLLRSQFKEIERLHSIIKEVREYIKRLPIDNEYMAELQFTYGDRDNILKILDKGE